MNRRHLFTVSAALLLVARSAIAAPPEMLVLTQTIPSKGVAGKLDHLAVDSRGERLFLANKPNNTLDIIDLKAGKLIRQIADQGKVSGVTYAADVDMIYVGNGAGVCNGFNGKDYQPVFSVPAANADNVHYHSGNKLVYVGQDEILSGLDAQTGAVKASINLPGAIHGFKIDKKAGKIYAVLTKPNLIAVIDVANHEIIDKFPLTLSDAGSPIAQDAENGLLFVGCPKQKPMIVAIDTKTGKEVASVEIPAGIDDLHFDSKRNRLYASCSASVLAVIEKQGEKYEVVARLETPKDSRTCTWKSGKLYLGVPRQEGKDGPEIRIYEARPVIAAEAASNTTK
jgi:DNA-binding beta-propeller fold protein YncE